MRRVLLVSYYAPPRPGIASIRTQQLIKYLPAHGWEVTVLTASLPGAAPDVVQTPYVDLAGGVKRALGLGDKSAHETLGIAPPARGARRSLRQAAVAWGYRLTSYPDAQAGWFFSGGSALAAELASGRYHAVLSSSPPFTTHLMLALQQLRIPWIADYRDLWGGSDAYASPLRRRFDRLLDTWTLQRVSAAVTVSQPMSSTIRSMRPGIPLEVIPNAFDEEEWQSIPFSTQAQTTFLYAGQLFSGRRDPRPLFRVVRSLIDAGAISAQEIRIVLYTTAERWLCEAIEQTGLEAIVQLPGIVSRDDVLRAERSADRLIVLLWDGAGSEGILTGKLFEYLGAGREIIAIGGPPSSAVDEVLAAAGAGVRVRDHEALSREVLDAVTEHRRASVRRTEPAKLAPFTAPGMAARFAALLDRVTGLRCAHVDVPANAARCNR
ncbi:MAG TPA: glycosyltransferase [Verrucomicrobiae bacterium]|nr:glycosyltransferase [Verrucomicrobiae bacterium]